MHTTLKDVDILEQDKLDFPLSLPEERQATPTTAYHF